MIKAGLILKIIWEVGIMAIIIYGVVAGLLGINIYKTMSVFGL